MYRKLCFSDVDKCKEIKGALVWLVHLGHSGCPETTAAGFDSLFRLALAKKQVHNQ